MLRHRVQGVCCPFARSSQFLQVVEGAGGVRSAGREPVGTMKSSLVSQAVILDCGVTFLLGQRPCSWHCANRGEHVGFVPAAAELRLWPLVAQCAAILWDMTHPPLFSPALWGQAPKQLPNGAYMYFVFVASCIIWAELCRKPCVSQLTGCKVKPCNFGGRIYFVSHEGNLAFCRSVQNSSCFIWINEACPLISCIFLLKAFLIMKNPKSSIFS